MVIKCCQHCVPPKRKPACHAYCPDYAIERKKLDEENEKARADRTNDAVGFIAENQRKKNSRWIKGTKGGHK